MERRERCKKLYNELPSELGRYKRHEDVIDQIEAFAREVEADAFERAIGAVSRNIEPPVTAFQGIALTKACERIRALKEPK